MGLMKTIWFKDDNNSLWCNYSKPWNIETKIGNFTPENFYFFHTPTQGNYVEKNKIEWYNFYLLLMLNFVWHEKNSFYKSNGLI